MMEFNDKHNGNDDCSGDNQLPTRDESTPSRSVVEDLAPILALVTVEEFRRLGVIPAAYDQSKRQLKLIFGTTVDEHHRREIIALLPDINIEWYMVAVNAFDQMYQRIARQYSAQAASGESGIDKNPIARCDAEPCETPPLSIFEQLEPTESEETSEPKHKSTVPQDKKTVLFVTPSGNISHHLKFAIQAEKFVVVTVKNLDQATAELEQGPVECVFIHENLHGQMDQFMQHMQTTRPETPLRFYSSEASLLMNNTRNHTTFDLVRRNLSLFSRLNDSQGSAIADHSTNMAKFADRMAIRLMIPDHCRLMIMTAAFLHNIAEETLRNTDGLQQSDIIRLSASKLESWDFPALVARMLRQMYCPIDENEPAPNDVVAMGGYILTAADVFCHLWPDYSSVGVHADIVRKKLENHLQRKVMPSVIETLVDVVKDDCTARLLRPRTFSVHFFESRGSQSIGLAIALQEADFVVTSSSNIDECVQTCSNASADLLIIRDSGSVQDVYDTLMSLALRGLAIDQLHTVLLLDAEVVTDALRLLSHGVEEILPAEAQNKAVITKLTRIKKRLEEQYRNRVSAIEQLGTHGSLSDMSLIDILESFRGNRRPARISVTAIGNQLTVYLEQGKIIAAECGESKGLDALLTGVSWRQGIWSVESIEASELPEPNVDEKIDAVLMAACTKLDQVTKEEEILQEPFTF
jgi:hypothetical protein